MGRRQRLLPQAGPRRVRRIALFALVALPACGRDRVWDIEFFGYKGIDVASVRHAVPVREGDAFAGEGTKEKIRKAVTATLGREPTDVTAVCCDENQDFVLFIGLPGSTNQCFSYNPEPKGTARLSDELTRLDARLDEAWRSAVQKGGESAHEDDSKGYALSSDPALHSLQVKLRQYALAREDELLSVLETSSDPHQRRIAAQALGYANKSPRQIEMLVRAARDLDFVVRNNAIRALGVLASSDAKLARGIPAGDFIDMLNSGSWTDRNKGLFLLDALSSGRDPALLAELQTRAMDSLIEMAKWRDTGHAYTARILLGRIAGIPEERLRHLASGPPDPILDALPRP